MSNIFNPDNAFFTFINKVVNVIYVSILWTVTGIPGVIIGIICLTSLPMTETLLYAIYIVMLLSLALAGPAMTALYYTCVKVIRRERGYVTRSYFHSYKENFKQGILIGLIFVVYAFIMYIDYQYASSLIAKEEFFGNVMFVIFTCVTVLAVFILVWIFPVLSRFRLTFKQLLLNALLISIKHFPTTILMAALIGGEFYLMYAYVPTVYLILLPLAIPGISVLIRSFLVERVLKKYLAEAEGTPEETGEDQWYRE